MQTYIILLRGVMPTGKNKVPMARLREILTTDGFNHVHTYIASGNVLLESELSATDIARRVRELIHTHIGPDLPVVVTTAPEILSLLHRNPFGDGYAPSRLFFVLFATIPTPEAIGQLQVRDFGDEKLALFNDGAVMYIPGTYGRGTLSSNYLEKQLNIPATTRNLNTITKLVELSKAIA